MYQPEFSYQFCSLSSSLDNLIQKSMKSVKGFPLILGDFRPGPQGVFHACFSFLTLHAMSLNNASNMFFDGSQPAKFPMFGRSPQHQVSRVPLSLLCISSDSVFHLFLPLPPLHPVLFISSVNTLALNTPKM